MSGNVAATIQVYEGVAALNTTQEIFLTELWKRARRSENGWVARIPDTEVKPGDEEAYQSLERQGLISTQKNFIGNAWAENRAFSLSITLQNLAYRYRPKPTPSQPAPVQEPTSSQGDSKTMTDSQPNQKRIELRGLAGQVKQADSKALVDRVRSLILQVQDTSNYPPTRRKCQAILGTFQLNAGPRILEVGGQALYDELQATLSLVIHNPKKAGKRLETPEIGGAV